MKLPVTKNWSGPHFRLCNLKLLVTELKWSHGKMGWLSDGACFIMEP